MDSQFSYFIRLSAVLEAMPDALVIIEPTGRIALVNRQTENLFGYERTELLGEFVEALMPERFRSKHAAHRDSYFHKPRVRSMGVGLELYGLHKNGSEFSMEISLSPLKTDEGVFALAAIRDISLRKKNEAKFKSILEATPDCLIIINNQGEIILVNARAEKLFGHKQIDIIGQHVEFLIPDRFHSNHVLHRTNYFLDPRVRPMGVGLELYGQHKNGDEFPIEISLSPLETEEGLLALAAVRDVTDRKKIEDAKAMLSDIVSYSDDAIIGKDLNAIIFSWNNAAEQLYGYSAKEAIGQSIAIIFPEQFKGELDYLINKIKDGEPYKISSTERLHKSGKLIPVTISPIKNAQGKIIGAASTARNISDQKFLEAQLRAKNQALQLQNRQIQEANRLKTAFLANMSHELRTPLNGIIGFTEILIDDEINPVSVEQKDFLNDILSSSNHLLQLINDMLDLAKIEAGKMDFFYEKVNLSKKIHEVCDVLRTLLAKKKIKLDVVVNPSVSNVIVDQAKFKQILYNYISNAIKFTPDNGAIQITAYSLDEQHFRLDVTDTGVGISPNDQLRLFVEFQQLDSGVAKKFQGTGLGLALTRRIVEAQGGKVGVSSQVNQGSTFYVILPRIKKIAKKKRAFKSDATYPMSSKIQTVLVVEDSPADRKTMVDILTVNGFKVVTAATGIDAITLCRKQHFDAITLDLLLPDMNGWEVLKLVHLTSLNETVPVIVTSIIAEKHITHGLSIHDYLVKPILPDELIASLKRAKG